LSGRSAVSESRRAAIAGLWAPDGAEFVEGKRYSGHEELDARIAGAYEEFVASDRYEVTIAGDVARHDDIVTFTIQLTVTALASEPDAAPGPARFMRTSTTDQGIADSQAGRSHEW
jgi:hypothetical protein